MVLSTPGAKFLVFYTNELSCTVHLSRPFWNWVRGLWRSWVALTLPLQSMPTSWTHSSTWAVLCCANLQFPEGGDLSQERAALPLEPHAVPCHIMSLPTVLGWLCSSLSVSVWDTHISPLTSEVSAPQQWGPLLWNWLLRLRFTPWCGNP